VTHLLEKFSIWSDAVCVTKLKLKSSDTAVPEIRSVKTRQPTSECFRLLLIYEAKGQPTAQTSRAIRRSTSVDPFPRSGARLRRRSIQSIWLSSMG
jgi:hypothetical protein